MHPLDKATSNCEANRRIASGAAVLKVSWSRTAKSCDDPGLKQRDLGGAIPVQGLLVGIG